MNIAVYGVSPNSQYITFKDKSGNNLSTDKLLLQALSR